MVRILVSGSGKMGRTIVDHMSREPGCEVVGVVDKLATGDTFAAADIASLPLFADAGKACDVTKPDAVIDFTNAAYTPELAAAAVPRGVRLVIGTSGLSEDFVQHLALECESRKLGGVVAANFAIGAVLMMHMAKVAARYLDSAEIIELHHDQKVDSPSGTALATARGMIEARDGRPFARNEPELEPVPGARAASHEGVTIHSVRLPGYVAHQEVIFGGLGQTLSIRHDSTGRDSFMPGVALAVREVMRRDRLVVGLASLVGLEE